MCNWRSKQCRTELTEFTVCSHADLASRLPAGTQLAFGAHGNYRYQVLEVLECLGRCRHQAQARGCAGVVVLDDGRGLDEHIAVGTIVRTCATQPI